MLTEPNSERTPRSSEQTGLDQRTVESTFTPTARRELIATTAFYQAERRGFLSGHEEEDWLLAEHEVDQACSLVEPEPRWDTG